MFALVYGLSRIFVEYFREPDAGVFGLFGLSMGQTLSFPMILIGLYLIFSAKGRRVRIEPVSGSQSVA